MAKNKKGREVDGVILLEKAAGISSNQALQRVKRLFDAKKAGHAGSLDPLATGLLPVFFGEATKFSQFLLDADKGYLATMKLGQTTETGDTEGKIIQEKPVDFAFETLVEILSNFLGAQQQVPSMFSALKHQGQPLYKLARKGKEVERKPRDIFIHQLDLLSDRSRFEEKGEVVLRVLCSKGTYIRNLVEDIGESAGCGAHLLELHREKSGAFTQMFSEEVLSEKLEQEGQLGLDSLLLPMDQVLSQFPSLVVEQSEGIALKQGRTLDDVNNPMALRGLVRVYVSTESSDDFLGLCELAKDDSLSAKRLLRTN